MASRVMDFPAPVFAGQYGETGLEVEVESVYDDEVVEGKCQQHGESLDVVGGDYIGEAAVRRLFACLARSRRGQRPSESKV